VKRFIGIVLVLFLSSHSLVESVLAQPFVVENEPVCPDGEFSLCTYDWQYAGTPYSVRIIAQNRRAESISFRVKITHLSATETASPTVEGGYLLDCEPPYDGYCTIWQGEIAPTERREFRIVAVTHVSTWVSSSIGVETSDMGPWSPNPVIRQTYIR